MKVRLVMLGKTKSAALRALVEEYCGRMRRYAEVEVAEIGEGSGAALRKVEFKGAARVVLLDAGGKEYTSQEFARWLGELRDRGAREVVFLCGGAEGFPEELRRMATMKLSLSRLTMPHELSRVVLAEQLYRAFTILAGHPYSK